MIRVHNRTNGRKCPYCVGKKAITGENDLLTLKPELAKEWDYERNSLDIKSIKIKSNQKVWWKCKNGHSYKAAVSHRTKGTGCPYCAGRILYRGNLVR